MRKENVRPWLLAENKSYPKERRELKPSKIEIQGIALKVIKDIKWGVFKGEYQILLQSYALFYSDARPFCFKILAYAIFIFILAKRCARAITPFFT